MMELVGQLFPWFLIIVCIISEAFFAASELSIISVDRVKLDAAARRGEAAAKRVIWFLDNPERLFGTTLLGTNLSTVTGSTVASLTLMSLDPERGEFWAMLLMSPLILVGGELLPKSLAQRGAARLALKLSGPLLLIHRLLGLPVLLIRSYTALLYRLLGIDEERKRALVSREELVLLMESELSEGEMLADEREMIRRIFAFSHLEARDSMIPLAEIVAISEEATVQDAAQIIAQAGFSRLPVFRDRVDNVVGILHQIDLLQADEGGQVVSELMHPPFFIPESQEIDDLLITLQREAALAAIIVDEFGGAVGMITLEDILEEIIGDIRDEFDEAGRMWRVVSDGWLINARAPIERLNESLELNLEESEDYDTLAGYLLEILKHLPAQGEQIELQGGYLAKVHKVSERAILEIHLSRVE